MYQCICVERIWCKKILKNVYRPGHYQEKSLNFYLIVGEEPCNKIFDCVVFQGGDGDEESEESESEESEEESESSEEDDEDEDDESDEDETKTAVEHKKETVEERVQVRHIEHLLITGLVLRYFLNSLKIP